MQNKLSAHEVELLEYSFYSLCEEIDLFYCSQLHADYFSSALSDSQMKLKVSDCDRNR